MTLLKCFTQYARKFGSLSSWPPDWKISDFIPIPKKGSAKESLNYSTIALILLGSKVMLRILQAGLQQYMNWEIPHVQTGFRKGRGTRDQIANSHWIIEKAIEFQKNIYFLLYSLCKSIWQSGSQQTVENSEKGGNTRLITLTVSWETCVQVKKQLLELDMEQLVKIGKWVHLH